MSDRTFERARDLFLQVIELAESERGRALAAIRRDDESMAAEVASLLQFHDDDAAPLLPPADASESARPGVGTLVAGRYRLEAVLGDGATGIVRSAIDTLTNQRVAVKLMSTKGDWEVRAWRREVATLRRLRLPGVVALLDDGIEGDFAFVVMERVEGAPFPGPLPSKEWISVEPILVRLLDVLHRLHQVGVIHRDLKPANVLVGEAGDPTLVDLGVAWDRGLFRESTAPDFVAGTPTYLAPEQIEGRPPDERSDLYSLGVMIFEALAGRPPRTARSIRDLREAFRAKPAPRISEHAEVPPHISSLIDALVAADPAQRPRSAQEALSRINRTPLHEYSLPYLPRPEAGAAYAALTRGEAVDVRGPPGSGKTRLIEDVADRLRRDGREVLRALPASSPSVSLSTLVGEDASLSPVDVGRRVAEALEMGTIVVADPWEALDEATRFILFEARSKGALLRGCATSGDEDVTISSLDRDELESLFAGSNRLYHLKEDAAEQLHRRTDGWPGAVRREIRGWIQSGIARTEGEKVVVDRRGLQLLTRMPGAEHPMALLEERRFTDPTDLAGRIVVWCNSLMGDGRSEEALGLAEEGVAALGLLPEADPRSVENVCRVLLRAAVRTGTSTAFDRVLYAVGRRAGDAAGALSSIERVARAGRLILNGDARRALDELRRPEPGEEVERCRHAARVLAARFLPPAEETPILIEALRWARGRPEPAARALAASWLGWRRYREHAFRRAARLHELSAKRETDPSAAAAGLLAAASAAMEAFELHRAEDLARRALTLVHGIRSVNLETRAEWLLRSVLYRSDQVAGPDEELVAAVSTLGLSYLDGLVCLTEACVAWRSGALDAARRMAEHAEDAWQRGGLHPGGDLLQAFRVWLSPEIEVDRKGLCERACSGDLPGVSLQTLAFAAANDRGLCEEYRQKAEELASRLPIEHRWTRREILSAGEALLLMGGTSPDRVTFPE